MDAFTLYIGNKNFSSWSLRAWSMLRHLGVPFREVVVPLDTPQFAERVAALNAASRVPVLVHVPDGGEARTVWDSLAICEYAIELTGRGLPRDAATRALARTVSAEMHSGFTALRSTWPMNLRARGRATPDDAARTTDLARIAQLWNACRARFRSQGEWLLGDYSLADAMFLPVATRLRTYGYRFAGQDDVLADRYAQTLLADPVFREWEEAALAETWDVPRYQVGAP